MSPPADERERYQQARKIFLHAWQLAPPDRRPAAESMCEGDAELLREVEELLKHADDDTDGLLPPELDTQPPTTLQQQLASLRDTPTRFRSGQRIADRYVLQEPIGAGGMGEVWRASDEMLGEHVALKFLHGRAAATQDRDRVERLLAEASAARRVTHRNVCRVHDVGKTQSEPFISMEFIAGRDLRSRLQHSGRLDALAGRRLALEITSALAAIHEADLLHRDLKPANVLLDEHGSAHLSDFGLAVSPAAIDDAEARAGTQAYMAPEVLRGEAPSVQSDLYALGLVLYEATSNRRAFQSGHETVRRADRGEHPPPPSELTPDVDPIVDRIIRRCLSPRPDERPESAAFLVRVLELPDPLDAVMALGDVPSADVIASSSASGLLSVPAARRVLLTFFVLLAALLASVHWLQNGSATPTTAPQSMATVAQAMLTQLDDTPWQPASRRFSYGVDEDRESPPVQLAQPQGSPWRLALRDSEDHHGCFWLREAATRLSPTQWDTALFGNSRITLLDPPTNTPDVRTIVLGADARLLAFQTTTPGAYLTSPEPTPALDTCAVAFALAGIDPDAARQVSSLLVGDGARQRIAWQIERPTPIRVEAEVAGDRLLAFYVLKLDEAAHARVQATGESQVSGFVQFAILVLLLGIAIPTATRHFRSGSSDYIGATRLAIACGALTAVSWWLVAHYPDGSLAKSLLHPLIALLLGLGSGTTIWLFYMAIEPFVRRDWPRALVASGRLLRGRIRDPLVLSHVLIGLCLGLLIQLFVVVSRAIADLPATGIQHQATLAGSPAIAWIPWLLDLPTGIAIIALEFLAAITFLRWVLRSRIAAALAFGAMAIGVALADSGGALDIAHALLMVPMMLVVLLRLGVLAFATTTFTTTIFTSLPLARSFDDWHASASAISIATVVAIALGTGYGLLWPASD